MFSLLSAVGQLFIFYSLLVFDSLVCTTITTIRKFLTIVISVAFHGNVLSVTQWGSVAMVFGAVAYDAGLFTVCQSARVLKLNVSPTPPSTPSTSTSPQLTTSNSTTSPGLFKRQLINSGDGNRNGHSNGHFTHSTNGFSNSGAVPFRSNVFSSIEVVESDLA